MRVAARRRLGEFLLDVAFHGPEDGVTVLFGSSGAGKSATLAIIAGLAQSDEALVSIGDRVLTDTQKRLFVAPERRRIGMVHQDSRLFPHLSVERNLRYGWRRFRGERRIDWNAVIDVLAIRHLLGRAPRDLSGGERQRVALGRAMLSQPALLLLDEPVSALDSALRREVLGFVAELKARFAMPMIYVTHSEDEARALGDHLVLIDAGRVTSEGPLTVMLPVRETAGEVVGPGLVRCDADLPVGSAVRINW